jgi:hypothetical protein
MVHTDKWCILAMTIAVRALVSTYSCSHCSPLSPTVLLRNLLNLDATVIQHFGFIRVIINVHLRTEFLFIELKFRDCSD